MYCFVHVSGSTTTMGTNATYYQKKEKYWLFCMIIWVPVMTVRVCKTVLVHRFSLIIMGGFLNRWTQFCAHVWAHAACQQEVQVPACRSPAALWKRDLTWSHYACIHSCRLTFEPIGYFKPKLVQRWKIILLRITKVDIWLEEKDAGFWCWGWTEVQVAYSIWS